VIENNKSDIRGYSQAMLRSINKYSLGINRKFCGDNWAGSGALMFAYPIGIFNTEEEKIDKEVEKIISITHSSEKSLFAAKVYCNLIAYLLNNREATRKSIVEKIEQLLDKKAITEDEKEVRENIKEVLSLIDVNDVDYVEEKIGNSGYVVETLNFSLYCFLKNLDNPRQAIIDAINIAGDSDTIGAITGALVGSLHNFSDNPEVPEEWHGLVKNFRKELEC
jgi:ADP-ribosylglycohydrolase